MFVAQKPFSQFMVDAWRQDTDIGDGHIKRQIDDLLDILVVRSATHEIRELVEAVREKIFDLRFQLIDLFSAEGLTHAQFSDEIVAETVARYQTSSFSKLETLLTTSLALFNEIYSEFTEKTESKTFQDWAQLFSNEKPSFETIRMLELMPTAQGKIIANWIYSSLDSEACFIIALLIDDGEITFPKKKIEKELYPFFRESIISYGAHSLLTGLWEPEDDVLYGSEQLMNSIRIFHSSLQLEFNPGPKYSIDTLQKVFAKGA